MIVQVARHVGGEGRRALVSPRTIVVATQFSAGNARVVATLAGLVMIFLHGTPATPQFGTSPYLGYDVFVARIWPDGDLIGGPAPRFS